MSVMDAIRQEAADWLVYLDDHPSQDPAQTKAFREWLEQDVRHRQVFEQIQTLWTSARPNPASSTIGPTLGLAGLLLLALTIGLQLPWRYWQADYHSSIGEVTHITLPDGSIAILNTNTAIDVNFSEEHRQIDLIRGEVFLDVVTNPDRPFTVDTKEGQAEALGTRYVVRQNDHSSQVMVYESRVRVITADHKASTVLQPGDRAEFDATSIHSGPMSTTATPDWSRGQLLFNRASVRQVVDRLAEYHTGVLMISDSLASSGTLFTGALPSGDSATAIRLLADSLRLKTTGLFPYIVYLDRPPAPDPE